METPGEKGVADDGLTNPFSRFSHQHEEGLKRAKMSLFWIFVGCFRSDEKGFGEGERDEI